MNDDTSVARKAEVLRQAFDRAFALPPAQAAEEGEDLLAIRVAGEAYAVRLRHISGIVASRKLAHIPTSTADFLGLAGIRSGIVAVFGLASLLGHGQAGNSARWLILCGTDDPIAFGFEGFDGYLRLPKAEVHADEALRGGQRYVEAVVKTDAGLRAVINVETILTTIRGRNRRASIPEGQ